MNFGSSRERKMENKIKDAERKKKEDEEKNMTFEKTQWYQIYIFHIFCGIVSSLHNHSISRRNGAYL